MELLENNYTQEQLTSFLKNSTSMQDFGRKLGYNRMPKATFNRILKNKQLNENDLGQNLNLIKSYSGKLINNLANQRFKNWTVIQYDIETSKEHKRSYWLCQCDCGTIKSIEQSGLKNKNDCYSCGCKRQQRLIGQKFHKVVVLSATNERAYKNEIYWKCQCDCGEIVIKSTKQLRETICSCDRCREKSKGEYIISNFLKKFQYDFQEQYSFTDLRGKDNLKILRFDFAIFNKNNLILLIEFQGKQHYYAYEHWGGEEKLKNQQKNDLKKENYCKQNNIPLLLFTYKELDQMTDEYMEGKINGVLRKQTTLL